jgi:hypothetical protein
LSFCHFSLDHFGSSWSWSDGSWIYNYLCNQCLLPRTLWVRTALRRGVPDTTLCDKVTCDRYSRVSSTNKTDHHDITEILLKVPLNTINPSTLWPFYCLLIVELWLLATHLVSLNLSYIFSVTVYYVLLLYHYISHINSVYFSK